VPVTLAQLIGCGVAPTQARIFIDPLNEAMDQYQINSRLRMSAFIAQGIHESGGFRDLEENLYYTTPERIYAVFSSQFKNPQEAVPFTRNPRKLANRVYDLRNGNGDEASDDGWRYRGRGIVQLTGRINYRKCDQSMNTQYELNPDLVAQPRDACLTYGNYWFRNQCNALADNGLIDAITKAINGPAMRGALERRQLYAKALNALV
jgi:putative chitinase